mmetsp:Transcript_24176/g.67711  ORF Transcript_24176/g.67711 Transcript_24176/m.67711 type:complete len:84 (+) Transcript_24176:3-254(+)
MAGLLGISIGALLSLVKDTGVAETSIAEKVAMTLAVLAYLEVRLGGSKESWELLAGKGRRYVERNLPFGTSFAQLYPQVLALF